MRLEIETIRKSFRPKKIRILLIGESPPSSGKFFYTGSPMTTYTARAFEMAHGKRFQDQGEFLAYFKESGCYLDDFSTTPLNRLSKIDREKFLFKKIDSLADRIRHANPEVIVILLRRIEDLARLAIEKSNSRSPVFVTPFPGQGYQNDFINCLSAIIKNYVPSEKSESNKEGR